jgi:hypothetical protein
MPFFWDWVWEKLSGVSKTATEFKSLGGPEMDNQVRKEVVRDGGKILAKKSNTSPKSTRVRSNNTSKTGGESTRKTVRSPAKKSKSKSKAL